MNRKQSFNHHSDTIPLLIGTVINLAPTIGGGLLMLYVAPELPVPDLIKFGLPIAGLIAGLAAGIALNRKITRANLSHFKFS